jgi:enoyl-CoA hydratase/carnithine racemase
VALACDERIASPESFIGLPEVALGVLPGWGGTVKAPKLIGFAASLPLILNPLKAWKADKAWKSGLVSEVVQAADLFERAVTIALGGTARSCEPSLVSRTLRTVFDTGVGRALASAGMKIAIRLQTGGKYPAPNAALKVMNAAFDMPESAAREMESRTFAELCQTTACKKCVQKFLDHQAAKKAKSGK